MSMSRKDYVAAAEIIANEVKNISDMTPVRKLTAEQTLRSVAGGMCTMFAMDNGRFDRHIFMRACGFGETVKPSHVHRNATFYYYGRQVKVAEVSGALVNVYYTSGWNRGPENMFTASVKELQL